MTTDLPSDSAPQPSRSTASPRRWLFVLAGAAALAALAAIVAAWALMHPRPESQFVEACAALARNDHAAARQAAQRLSRLADYAPHAHFLEGAVRLHEGQLPQALDEFGHAVDHPRLRVATLTLSGRALYQLGNLPDARRLLQQAVAADPRSVDAFRWLATCEYDLGLNDEARTHLLRVAELAPQDPRPHRLLGLLHKDFERYAEAVRDYRESLRRGPDQPDGPEIRRELAECHVALRQYQEALEVLARCPPTGARRAMEAECQYGLGDSVAAQRSLAESLRREPGNLAAWTLSARIAADEGDLKRAVDGLSRAVVAFPKDYAARYQLSQAFRRLGDVAEADRHAAIAEKNKALRVRFSQLHEQAAESVDPEIRFQLGQTALEMDRPDLAKMWFRMTLSLDPQHSGARRMLSEGWLTSPVQPAPQAPRVN